MPREFYPSELTDSSFSVLERLVNDVPGGILIGGWGTWVRNPDGPKSHDIDMIVSNDDLDAIRRRPDVADFSATDHFGGRKYLATVEGVHLGLHVPYQSRLGRRLQLRAESLIRHAERVNRWHVLTVSAHAATKVAALLDRPETAPGEKDRHELLGLLGAAQPSDVVAVIAMASELPIGSLEAALTGELFGYLEETAGIGKNDKKTLRVARAAWNSEIVKFRVRRAAGRYTGK